MIANTSFDHRVPCGIVILDLIDPLLQRLHAGEAVALCVLVRARGSTPQAAGAAMLVMANGQTLGTLGGGCVEAEVRTRALRSLLSTPAAGDQLATFKLDHDYGWDDGLMCGGMMDVSIQIHRSITDASSLIGIRDALLAKQVATYELSIPDESNVMRSFAVPFAPTPTLLIAGAGHVGQAIAAMADAIGFEVVVFDDRADVVSETRFPKARRMVGTIETELRRWPIDSHTFVVIVTRGHRNDADALAAVVRSPATYIGMIGSNRKVRTILDGLLRENGIPRDRLMSVRAPIGLSIGAVTPAEIAVSVCAELIAVRRGHTELTTSLKIADDELATWFDRDSLSQQGS